MYDDSTRIYHEKMRTDVSGCVNLAVKVARINSARLFRPSPKNRNT
jgi:hypothetical protein